MQPSPLHDRIQAVAGRMTYRALADATGHNAETIRRYMQGQAPSVEFLSAICARLDVSAQWLLTGRGPMKSSDARAHHLREANPSELLSAIAEALERLTERVDRIDLFVQTMEHRLRTRPVPASGGEAAGTTEQAGVVREFKDPHDDGAVAQRARSLADAFAQRPRPDAG